MLPGHGATDGPAYDIHRLKGRFLGNDGSEMIIQGVREIFDVFENPSQPGDSSASRVGKLVIIGRHLDSYDFPKSLEQALQPEARA